MEQPVFIDTSAFYALASSSDGLHARAVRGLETLVDDGTSLYTSVYVVTETMALVHRRLGMASLQRCVETIRHACAILWADEPTHWDAWDMLEARAGRLSFVDCTSVLLARRLGAAVFAFDDHFNQEGLRLLPG
jgi:predicted nucleic acid-binding protein